MSSSSQKKLVGHRVKNFSSSVEPTNPSNEDHRATKIGGSNSATQLNETIQSGQLRRDLRHVECFVCKSTNEWRIRLRQCGHIICVRCALQWLQHCIDTLSKARIGCRRQGCVRRIHENDIYALLEPNNNQLNDYMLPDRRLELQRKHENTVVEYALGGRRSTSVHCPECNTLYIKELGCNYVQCSLQSCGTWFCFGCGEVVESMLHFGKGKDCMLGPIDLYRASYLLRMSFDASIVGIILFLPAIVYASLVLFPVSMFILFICKCIQRLTVKLKSPISTIMKVLLVLPISLIGLIVALISIPVGFTFICLYIAFLILRLMPTVMTLNMLLKVVPTVATLIGVNSISNLLTDATEAKVLLEIEAYQNEQEKSELVDEEQMTKSQALEGRIRREDHEARYARSTGLDKLKTGAVNVSNAVVKASQNFDAIKESRWKDVKLVGLSDVKFSGSGLMKKAVAQYQSSGETNKTA